MGSAKAAAQSIAQRGMRRMQTFRKLPMMKPKTNMTIAMAIMQVTRKV